MIGRKLGHFEITGSIGAGGMGVVYKANDVRLRRTVALKLLPPELAADRERRARFEREAQAASALNHPNIVTVYEIDRVDGRDFIAMEFIEGETLDRVIARGVPVAEALRHATQIGEALTVAHAAGIVHRDLKPGNVIVKPDGSLKVLDFGLAKRVAGGALDTAAPTQSAAPQSLAGSVLGTVAYMSPEQAEGRTLDARSDVFSFGVVLYEMLTGRRPFAGDSAAQLMGAILRDTPPPARSLRKGLPAELDRVLAKALEKDVAYRYQTMADVVADLKRASREPTTGDRRAGSLARRTGLVLALAAVAALAVYGLRLRAPRSAAPVNNRLLSTFPGSHRAPSLSPDGRMLAFVDDAKGTPQVWVKPVGEGDPVQITSGEAAASMPRWSPRGDQIVFERSRRGIWSVPPLGGAPRQILERGWCASFFPDGQRLVFDRGPELWTARVDGGEARRVEGVQENFYSFYLSHCAAVSPDGRSLAYFQPQWGPHGDFWIIPVAGGKPRRLTSDVSLGGGAVFSRDGRFLIVSSSRAGSQTLWRVPIAGGEPEPITTGAGEDVEPELSLDGRTLVYSNSRNSQAVMLLDTRTGVERELVERRAHTNGAVFSPDGSRVAFFSFTEENEQIFTVGADGRDLRQVTRGRPGIYIMPRFSPDGSSLYYFTHDPPSLRRIPASGGRAETVVDGWLWGEVLAWLDPRGGSIAYTQGMGPARRAGIRELASGHERALGAPIAVSSWTRAGDAVLGTTDEQEIVRCPADGGACAMLGRGGMPVPSADGSRIFFHRRGRALDDRKLQSVDLWVMSAEGKDERKVATLEPQSTLASRCDISPRDECVWVQFRRGKQELWLAQLAPGS